MPLAGQAMEAEVSLDGLQVGAKSNGYALLFGFTDVAAGGFAEVFIKPINPGRQVKDVMEKGGVGFVGFIEFIGFVEFVEFTGAVVKELGSLGSPPRSSRYFQRRSFPRSTAKSKRSRKGVVPFSRGAQKSVKGRLTPRFPVRKLATSMRGRQADRVSPLKTQAYNGLNP